jgi:hypothetical protein
MHPLLEELKFMLEELEFMLENANELLCKSYLRVIVTAAASQFWRGITTWNGQDGIMDENSMS